MNSQLELVFLNTLGRKNKIVVDAPRGDLTQEEVQGVMEKIIAKNIFTTTGGDLVKISSARIVTTTVDEIIPEEE